MKNVKIIDIRLIPLNKTKKCEYSFKAVYFSEKEILFTVFADQNVKE